jgi:hypothetical protein
MPTFQVPFVCKGPAASSTDGFEICVQGIVVLKGHEFKIFDSEQDRDNKDGENEVICLSLSDLDSIKCQPFRSIGGSYYGGRVELVGYMDSDWKERLVLKMEMTEFNRFKSALKKLHDHP